MIPFGRIHGTRMIRCVIIHPPSPSPSRGSRRVTSLRDGRGTQSRALRRQRHVRGTQGEVDSWGLGCFVWLEPRGVEVWSQIWIVNERLICHILYHMSFIYYTSWNRRIIRPDIPTTGISTSCLSVYSFAFQNSFATVALCFTLLWTEIHCPAYDEMIWTWMDLPPPPHLK